MVSICSLKYSGEGICQVFLPISYTDGPLMTTAIPTHSKGPDERYYPTTIQTRNHPKQP
jgi:hypothetical protein